VLIKKVASFITENNLISKSKHIAVALSGGRDSVALLHILNHLKSQLEVTLSAIHINHGIRGGESDKDQAFVNKLCETMGTECDFYRLSGFNKNSAEDVLRNARYKIFDEYLNNNKDSRIATGHHLNDQIETYLMRLFKGSGTKGLLGIPLVRGNYIRPLLQISRDEINAFCIKHKISYREDTTNSEYDKLRNKVRLKLVPQIEQIFGKEYPLQFLKSHNTYKNLYNENLHENYTVFKKISIIENNEIEIRIRDYKTLSKLRKTQYLEYCFSYVYGLDCQIGSEQLAEFDTFISSSQTGTKFLFADSIEVLKDRDKLIFFIQSKKSEKKKKLNLDKSIKFRNCRLILKEVLNDSVTFDDNKSVEYISADNIYLPLTIRMWQEGDYFYPLGSNNRQKVSDFFTNNKVSRINKKKIPIILNQDQIVWIAGYRIDHRYKVKKNSKSVFKIEMIYE